MIQLTVLYPNEPGKKFNMDYYLNSHIKGILNVPGGKVVKATVEHGFATMDPSVPAPFICISHLVFNNMEDLIETFGLLPNIAADTPNYSEVTPLMQLSEIKI